MTASGTEDTQLGAGAVGGGGQWEQGSKSKTTEAESGEEKSDLCSLDSQPGVISFFLPMMTSLTPFLWVLILPG